MLQCISDAGLKLNDRCVFGQKELSFIRHTISVNGLLSFQSNVKVIQDAPVPMDIQSLESLLGMTGPYAKFLRNFSDEVKPLREISAVIKHSSGLQPQMPVLEG